VNLLVVILIFDAIVFPSNMICIIPGIPLLPFFPGYALLAALSAKKEGLDSVERLSH